LIEKEERERARQREREIRKGKEKVRKRKDEKEHGICNHRTLTKWGGNSMRTSSTDTTSNEVSPIKVSTSSMTSTSSHQ
jgi:hypothetical protein